MEFTLVQNLLTLVSAGLGALLAVSIGVSHRQLCAMISFAAGTLLGTTVFHILPDAWGALPLSTILLALASGYGLFFVISRYVFHVCPACAASHFEHQPSDKLKNIFFLLAIALSIHSAMDGMAVALGDNLQHNEDHSIFFTILIHKLPEGLALCALLLRAGYERKKALLWTLLLETPTTFGWIIGMFLLKSFPANQWLNLMLVHVGGGFIYLALHAAINESEEHSPRVVFLFFLTGMILMGWVQ
jgi:zinc and cadmium transporter